ncbi:MAG TPA: hypothetical protein PK264_16890, partial [Hyphomicrobiaceae bacterium]|nr:hypothetical protein [Hyphomicrobiaceae bacterium]
MQSTVAMQGIWRRIAEPGRALASAKPWSIDYLAVSTGFLLAFLLIDWVTFTPAFAPRGVTPWNPAIGFALAVVLRYGLGLLPILVVAPLISDVVV